MEKISQANGHEPEESDLVAEVQDEDEVTRKVVTRCPHRKVGRVNAPYFQEAPIEHESLLEKRFVHRAMLVQGLMRITHQPFRINIGEGRRYTPDFLLDFGAAKAVVEIKWSTRVDQYSHTFNAATRALEARGIAFYVLSELEIDREDKGDEALLIARYAKSELPPHLLEVALSLVRQAGTLSLLQLEKNTGSRELVMHLVAHRRLHLLGQHSKQDSLVAADALKTGIDAFQAELQVTPWAFREPVESKPRKRQKLPKRVVKGTPYTLTSDARKALRETHDSSKAGRSSIQTYIARKLAASNLEALIQSCGDAGRQA